MTKQMPRLEKSFEMVVPGACETVFPLLCPMLEYEWLPHWNCELIYSASGRAEAGCVFQTDFTGRKGMTWVNTKYDPPVNIQYTAFKPDSHVMNLEISLVSQGTEATALTWMYTFTAITSEGERFLSEYSDEFHRKHMAYIHAALSHYIKKGTMISD